MTIEKLLKKEKLLTKKMIALDYNTQLLNEEVDTFFNLLINYKYLSQKPNLQGRELALYVAELVNRVNDMDNPNYDAKLNMEIVRYTNRTNIYKGPKFNELDEYETDRLTDIYDDYIDSQSGNMKL